MQVDTELTLHQRPAGRGGGIGTDTLRKFDGPF